MLTVPWTISGVKNKHGTSTIHMPTIRWIFSRVNNMNHPHANNPLHFLWGVKNIKSPPAHNPLDYLLGQKRPHDNNHSCRFSFMTLWDGLQGVRTIGHWFKEFWRARKRSGVENEKSEGKQWPKIVKELGNSTKSLECDLVPSRGNCLIWLVIARNHVNYYVHCSVSTKGCSILENESQPNRHWGGSHHLSWEGHMSGTFHFGDLELFDLSNHPAPLQLHRSRTFYQYLGLHELTTYHTICYILRKLAS